ncbi:MAG TPA: DUF6067 family protein [Bacteroidales bacterium]|nr:DUF6067 family protein [Bacteroidales bacterium]
MIKKILLLGLILSLTGQAFSQWQKGQIDPSKVPAPVWHLMPEYTFDKPVDTLRWMNEKPGLHAAFGSSDELYLRCEVPSLPATSAAWETTAWRGERLNAQILVWSTDTLDQVRIEIQNLSGSEGEVILSENIRPYRVRYVLSNAHYGDKDLTCWMMSNDSVYLMPDRLEEFKRFTLPGRTIRPLWITLDIPAEALPGTYTGTFEIASEGHVVTLPVQIKVQNQLLPDAHDWKYRLDLWQNPWVIAWYHHVSPWSDEHKALLKHHLKLYAGAGGNFITTYAVHSPWSDNSNVLESTMIEWCKKKDGSWKFDYSVFDMYVELAMEAGIDKAITIYTPLPWGDRFRYLDEVTGNYLFEVWRPESQQYRSMWKLFLTDLKAHLQQKGWFSRTYIGINENALENTLLAIQVIREHSPEWKITYAGDWHPELSPLLDDYSVVISSEPDLQQLAERKSQGRTTTFYVCCTPAKPNNFVFSPPVEGRFISWYVAAKGYDGFLRWAYDAWPADPVRDARHTLWPAGDCYLVYPGGNSSIRFEKLREGITDHEKIRLLLEMAQDSGDRRVKDLSAELVHHLGKFIDDPVYSKRTYDPPRMTEMISNGQQIIHDLSDALAEPK